MAICREWRSCSCPFRVVASLPSTVQLYSARGRIDPVYRKKSSEAALPCLNWNLRVDDMIDIDVRTRTGRWRTARLGRSFGLSCQSINHRFSVLSLRIGLSMPGSTELPKKNAACYGCIFLLARYTFSEKMRRR
jgi:hypothetical protein